MDLKFDFIKKSLKNKHIDIDSLIKQITDLENETFDLNMKQIIKTFNDVGYKMTNNKYEFYNSRYQEWANIDFSNSQSIKNITNIQLKEFLMRILKIDKEI